MQNLRSGVTKTGAHGRNLWTARNTLTLKGCFSPPFCISLSTFKIKIGIVDLFGMIRTSSREQRELGPWLKLLQRRPPLKKLRRKKSLLRRSRLLRRRRSNARARGRRPGLRLGTGTSDQAHRSPNRTISELTVLQRSVPRSSVPRLTVSRPKPRRPRASAFERLGHLPDVAWRLFVGL